MIKFISYVCIISFILVFFITFVPIFVLLLYLLSILLMPFGWIFFSLPIYLPTIFLCSLLILIFYVPFQRHRLGVLTASVLTFGLLVAIPIPYNRELERRAQAAISDDHDDIIRPFRPRILAVRYDRERIQKAPTCDGLCKRALINSIVDLFIVEYVDANGVSKTSSFKFGKDGSCVDPASGNDIHIDSEKGIDEKPNIDLILLLRKTSGECIIRDDTPIARADAIINVVDREGLDSYQAFLNPRADTLSVKRITVEQRIGDEYRETYRQTGTSMEKLSLFFAPSFADRHGSPLRIVLSRAHETRNLNGRFKKALDWSGFLTHTLGLNLALSYEDEITKTRDTVSEILRRHDRPKPDELEIIDGFLRRLSFSTHPTDLDRSLILAIVENRLIPISSHFSRAWLSPENSSPEYVGTLARILFQRLREVASSGDDEQGQVFGKLISSIPVGEFLNHREDMEWLARQVELRSATYPASVRLSEFGAAAAPTLLFMVEDSKQNSNTSKDRGWDGNPQQRAYRQGLQGLCKLGSQAEGVMQPLFDWIDAGKVALTHGDWELAIATLASLGAKEDDIWRHVEGKSSDKTWTREKVSHIIDRKCPR